MNHYIFLFSIQNLSYRPIVSWSEECYVVGVVFFALRTKLYYVLTIYLSYFLPRKCSILFKLLFELKSIILLSCEKGWISVLYFIIVYLHFLQLKWYQLVRFCTKKKQLFCPVHCKNSMLLFYLIRYKVAVSFILKEIRSKVKRDANNGDFVAMYFLEIFHRSKTNKKGVSL